jgi:hypothetical protein
MEDDDTAPSDPELDTLSELDDDSKAKESRNATGTSHATAGEPLVALKTSKPGRKNPLSMDALKN